MKKSISVIFSILLLLFTQLSFSQGLNSILALDANNVITVGSQGKILRSSNAGITWTRYTIGSVDYKCISTIGSDVWIGASEGKVYKTTNVNSPLTGYSTGLTSVNGVSFANSSTGYACGNAGGIYKSTDGGLTWILRNTGVGNVKLNAIDFLDDANGIAVGDNGYVYWTSTGASNWSALTSGTNRNLLAVNFYGSNGAYITGEWGVILKFTGTLTLTSVKSRITSDIRSISGTSAADIHIVGGGGFIRNNKNSSNEFLNFEVNPVMTNLVSISYLNSTTGYAISSNYDGIIKTTNSGQSWEFTANTSMSIAWVPKVTGLIEGIGNNLCTVPQNRDELFVVYQRGIYRSIDKGENWTYLGIIPPNIANGPTHSFYVSPLDTNVMIAAVENAPTDRIVRSTDYGNTWTVILEKDFTSYGTPLEIDHVNPAIFYFAPDGGGFYKSTNSGISFTEISGNYPFRSPCDISVQWEQPNVIFIADGVTSASEPGEVFKSSNGGVNWTKVHTNPGVGSAFSEIPCIMNSAFDSNLLYLTNWSGSMRFKSTNAGDNWFAIQSTTFSGWTGEICQEDPSLVVTGNYGQNSSLTTNGGANWNQYAMPAGGCGAGMIVPGRDYIVAAECSAILKLVMYTFGPQNIEEGIVSNNVPDKYALYQNYPNPFNPSTEIKFDVLKTGNVNIKVYDETGKNIMTLTNGVKNPGTYSVKFDASALSSGLYYYVMETGGTILSKKMVLVK